MRPYHIVVSCEHGGNVIPLAYKYLFNKEEKILESHLGWDPGALQIGRVISDRLKARFFHTKVSRLLVDCNRSVDKEEIFSRFSSQLNNSVKKYLIEQYYNPYRRKVEDHISGLIREKAVIHLSIHTFTPVLHGKERLVDIGLLFDDDRESEHSFCERWKMYLDEELRDLLVLFNTPYHGKDDGFTSYLRRKYTSEKYLGIELEVNQKWTKDENVKSLAQKLSAPLERMLDESATTLMR
jgi:predicted N-formylglutamate amidohydrolase